MPNVGCKLHTGGSFRCGKSVTHYATTHYQTETGIASARLAICRYHAEHILHWFQHHRKESDAHPAAYPAGNLTISAVFPIAHSEIKPRKAR